MLFQSSAASLVWLWHTCRMFSLPSFLGFELRERHTLPWLHLQQDFQQVTAFLCDKKELLHTHTLQVGCSEFAGRRGHFSAKPRAPIGSPINNGCISNRGKSQNGELLLAYLCKVKLPETTAYLFSRSRFGVAKWIRCLHTSLKCKTLKSSWISMFLTA